MKLFFMIAFLSSQTILARTADIANPFSAMLAPVAGYVSSGCSINSLFTLENGDISGPFATLENFVDGFCEIYVPPVKQWISIDFFVEDVCGTVNYSGTLQTFDAGRLEVVIRDNRNRLCLDLQLATIIVELKKMGEKVPYQTLYSYGNILDSGKN